MDSPSSYISCHLFSFISEKVLSQCDDTLACEAQCKNCHNRRDIDHADRRDEAAENIQIRIRDPGDHLPERGFLDARHPAHEDADDQDVEINVNSS